MSLDERTGKASEDDKPISSDKKAKFKSLCFFVTERQVLLIFSFFKRKQSRIKF
jgi:hypothetical protein